MVPKEKDGALNADDEERAKRRLLTPCSKLNSTWLAVACTPLQNFGTVRLPVGVACHVVVIVRAWTRSVGPDASARFSKRNGQRVPKTQCSMLISYEVARSERREETQATSVTDRTIKNIKKPLDQTHAGPTGHTSAAMRLVP